MALRRQTLAAIVSLVAGQLSPRFRGTDATEIDAGLPPAAAREELPAFDGDDWELTISDGTYYAPTSVEGLAPLGDLTAALPYSPKRFDCENYARFYRVLAALLLGVNSIAVVFDWSGGHAYNLIVTADGDGRLYDPQYDRFVELGESDLYVGEDVHVVF